MAKTRSMTRNQNYDDDDASSSSCSRKRFKTFDKGDVASWSDLNDDVLCLVMTQLGVVDFIAFSGVCTTWRSYALSNREWFMASRPRVSICIDNPGTFLDSHCCLEDSEGRRFETILPHSAGMNCVGLTCGYVILFGRETCDFRLVNPITRHELYFPDYPLYVSDERGMRAILFFSPTISGFVFVVLNRVIVSDETKLLFYIEGKRRWNHVFSTIPIRDLQDFKGMIYTLHSDCSLGERRLYPNAKRKWTLLETNNSPNLDSFRPLLVSACEKLYMISDSLGAQKVMELDFGEMKWVVPTKTIEEYAYLFCCLKYSSSAAIKPESWTDPQTPYTPYGYKGGRLGFNHKWMWYFPHDCLSVNRLDE